MTLAGRTVFVSGANSGIGLATALRFAREGANVAIFGAICNCASAAGLIPSAMQVGYAAAKFAVVGKTRGAALECAKDGVRVNVVCPGATTGEMWVKFAADNPDRAKLALAKHPLGRVGLKEEVADALLFLCRDATFTTGHALSVDGGRTAG